MDELQRTLVRADALEVESGAWALRPQVADTYLR